MTSYDPFALGRRVDILRPSGEPALSSYNAEESKTTTHVETAFRNFNLALLDNLAVEYAFLTTFFDQAPLSQTSSRCSSIFAPTFTLGQSLTRDLTSTSYDCLGILLCVRLNQASAFDLQRHKVPIADSYINATSMLLWPRFQLAMDAHIDSIKGLAGTLSARSAASKLSFSGSAADASKLSTAPHFLTQRFGQFVHAILAVSGDAGDDEPVAGSLLRLRAEYEAFLAKASRGAGADVAKRERFLTNNYALVLTIIGDVPGRLAAEMREHFQALTMED